MILVCIRSMKVSRVILKASPKFDNVKGRFYCMNMQALEERLYVGFWDTEKCSRVRDIFENLS